MTGILAIWAACAFWVVVYFEVERLETGFTRRWFYIKGSAPQLKGMFWLCIFAPIGLAFWIADIHEESKWK